MNRKELIEAIALETNMPETKVKSFLDSFFNVVGNALSKNDNVKIIGYLDFSVRKTSDTFVHPITKAIHKAKYPKAIKIKVGKTLKSMANGTEKIDTKTTTKKTTASKTIK